MEKFTQKYTLAHLINELPDGYEYSMQDWPLHVTIADVFEINGTTKDLLESFAERLETIKPFQALVENDEWFGESKNIHVRLLNKTKQLEDLHYAVVEVLEKFDVRFNRPEYVRTGYRPHATVKEAEGLSIGDMVSFDSITLIDMFPNDDPTMRRIVGTVKFQ